MISEQLFKKNVYPNEIFWTFYLIYFFVYYSNNKMTKIICCKKLQIKKL